jgi:hypothetical protein
VPQNQPHHPNNPHARGAYPLQEFVDEAHEVTEEERNRPRYGRPERKPEVTEPEQPKPADKGQAP